MVMLLIQCTTVTFFHMGKHTITTKMTMISNLKQEAQFAYKYIFLCLSGFEGCSLTKYLRISITWSMEVIPLIVPINIPVAVHLIGWSSGDQNFHLIPLKSGNWLSVSHFSLKLISWTFAKETIRFIATIPWSYKSF